MRTLIVILSILFLGVYGSRVKTRTEATVSIDTVISPNPADMLKEGQSLLQEGDLVVRLNNDPASYFIKNFNRRDKRFSHAGIVLFENGYPYVYHIIKGKEKKENEIRKDSLCRFGNAGENKAFGIYRYNFSASEINNLKKIIHKWYAGKIQFDTRFDYHSDEKMYCSEMVSKAVAAATKNRIHFETTGATTIESASIALYLHIPLRYTSKLQIMPIDNLYLHPCCSRIGLFDYSAAPVPAIE